jgi:4-hydroxythreonine-4-phosphate dehydrogenase
VDQGLAPLKTVHFDDAINITGGLKHLRVSPDHGPAQDLFLTDKASSASFQLCWQLVISYLSQERAMSPCSPDGTA